MAENQAALSHLHGSGHRRVLVHDSHGLARVPSGLGVPLWSCSSSCSEAIDSSGLPASKSCRTGETRAKTGDVSK